MHEFKCPACSRIWEWKYLRAYCIAAFMKFACGRCCLGGWGWAALHSLQPRWIFKEGFLEEVMLDLESGSSSKIDGPRAKHREKRLTIWWRWRPGQRGQHCRPANAEGSSAHLAAIKMKIIIIHSFKVDCNARDLPVRIQGIKWRRQTSMLFVVVTNISWAFAVCGHSKYLQQSHDVDLFLTSFKEE